MIPIKSVERFSPRLSLESDYNTRANLEKRVECRVGFRSWFPQEEPEEVRNDKTVVYC